MAFGAEELRVLRRALALALDPSSASAEDGRLVRDCLRLAESVDEALHEGARLRAFLLADLARYRAALPGTAGGYLVLLEEVLAAGYRPNPDDLAALRALRGNPAAAALLDRCRVLAEQDVRTRLAARSVAAVPSVPASRTRLLALPGGRSADRPEKTAEPKPPARPPARTPRTDRPIPTPGEVFPPRRKSGPPPANPPQQLAAG
ncbi:MULTISPECIES: hypothetical protein [unclassified Streptomyces]|uniref:hypothetical protein n=1 Tax=unclassified Streptomyces TaxID=2593676 RepID=UPI003817E6D9